MSKQKKQANILKGLLAVAVTLLVLELCWLMFALFGSNKPADNDSPTVEATVHQEPTETLDPESPETEETAYFPWEETDAKQPEDYTWEEYEALTGEQQRAFRDYLGDGFEQWLNAVREQAEVNPWDESGAKQPEDYTWEEFEALTASQQMAFQKYLGEKGFEDWQSKAQEELETNPWEEPGAKQPKDYTWKEFEALTAAQQMAFQNHLGEKGFADWLNKVQEKPEDEKPATENPWEKPGAKQPADYTWAEFEALTGAQQMAFQKHLGEKGFEAWLNKVQEKPEDEKPAAENPWEGPGAKQPKDYTWEEFEALTAAQQIAFQNYLGETDFEAWLNRVQIQTEENPWDAPGAKQPADYTWAEFEELTGAQQMAFQNYLGEAGFEAWLNRVNP